MLAVKCTKIKVRNHNCRNFIVTLTPVKLEPRIECDGKLEVEPRIECGGKLEVEPRIECGGKLEAEPRIECDDKLEVEPRIECGGKLGVVHILIMESVSSQCLCVAWQQVCCCTSVGDVAPVHGDHRHTLLPCLMSQ